MSRPPKKGSNPLDAKVSTFAAKLGSNVVALFAAPMAPVAMAA